MMLFQCQKRAKKQDNETCFINLLNCIFIFIIIIIISPNINILNTMAMFNLLMQGVLLTRFHLPSYPLPYFLIKVNYFI